MRRLLTALGVDYDQWRALTIASIKLDLRTGTFGNSRANRRSSGKRALFSQMVFHVILGVFMALLVGYLGDSFVAGTILFTYVMLMVGTTMLVDHNAAITSPEDYGILGFQPITSRTFFASKLTNALFYTVGVTTALGVFPTAVFFFKYGVWVGCAAVLGLYSCGATVTLTIVAGYAALMQRVGTRRLRMWLSYVQLATGFLVYGGFFVASGVVSKGVLLGLSLPRTTWFMLLPPTWFAGYLQIASGSTAALDLIPAAGSLAVMGFLVTRLRGRMSLQYAARLGELTSSAAGMAPGKTRHRAGLWFRKGEARAVAILVRGHFRNDLKFRMGVLAVLPLTVFYLILGLRDGGGGAGNSTPGQNLSLVTVAAMLFPILLKMNLAYSDSFKASWVFFASPTDRTRLIFSSKNVLVVLFLVPYLVFLGLTLSFMTHDPIWVVGYLLLVGAVSHLALVLAFVADPELPFSKPVEKGRGSSRMVITILAVGVMAGLVPLLSRVMSEDPTRIAAMFLGLLLLSSALGRFTRRRIERRSRSLEFKG